MNKVYYRKIETAIGTLFLAETGRGLAHIQFGDISEEEFLERLNKEYRQSEISEGGEENAKAELQLSEYLEGKRKKFDLMLDFQGTPFQKRILERVAAIPYGQVKTYGDIAREEGSPKAFRAVGSANARNRLPLVIPCHRVVASNGLGGYGGGLPLKVRLLEMEKQISK